MNFKKTILLVCLALCLSGASICAGEIDFDSDDLHFQCCSFAVQETNETVFAFRQDAPLGGDGVIIHNDTLKGEDIIVQEVDDPDSHFIHAIITEDGWVASHGGYSVNDTETLDMEDIAREMLSSKNISSHSLESIRKIFAGYGYGHFLIKAPDGRYAAVYNETVIEGQLDSGEFLVVPNEYSGFATGKYAGYGKDPVDAVINISSHEDSGTNRRNLYTYDYKMQDTDDGERYGVNVYVTNDNGRDVGLNTSEIVSHFYLNDDYYPPEEIPENPDKLHAGDYIFENQTAEPPAEFKLSQLFLNRSDL